MRRAKALVVRASSQADVEDIVRIAYAEGKKIFATQNNISVPWLQWVDKIQAWVVVVEMPVVAEKLVVSERARDA